MTPHLTIVIVSVFCILLGLWIGHNARKERDQQINKLEYELTVKQNIIDSNNETINRLRRENEKLKNKIKTINSTELL